MDSENNDNSVIRVIINADDLGLSRGNNIGIVNAMQNGLVSSTSLMACGIEFDHAVELLLKAQIQNVGVHLVLDEERPVCDPLSISSITTPSGVFFNRGTLLKKLLFSNQINEEHVYAEFRAQVQKIIDSGLTVTHLDGHGHVHVYPKVNAIVSRLADEFSIRRIRFPAERFFYMDLKNFNLKKYINKVIVTSFSLSARKQFLKRNSIMPDGFMGMLFGGNLNLKNLEKVFVNMPSGSCVEIMTHPGATDDKREQIYGHWNYHWTDELQAVLSRSRNDIRQMYNCDIITYEELGN